jgi:hypothetical protein
MTLCASPRFEITFEDLSKAILVRRGRKNSSIKSSMSNTSSQIHPTSLGGGATQNTMVELDNTLRMSKLQGDGSKDPKQHLFVCETIWVVKNVQDEAKNTT